MNLHPNISHSIEILNKNAATSNKLQTDKKWSEKKFNWTRRFPHEKIASSTFIKWCKFKQNKSGVVYWKLSSNKVGNYHIENDREKSRKKKCVDHCRQCVNRFFDQKFFSAFSTEIIFPSRDFFVFGWMRLDPGTALTSSFGASLFSSFHAVEFLVEWFKGTQTALEN